jgi:hypothetical protein
VADGLACPDVYKCSREHHPPHKHIDTVRELGVSRQSNVMYAPRMHIAVVGLGMSNTQQIYPSNLNDMLQHSKKARKAGSATVSWEDVQPPSLPKGY